jgi:hypothetical protein
VRSRKIIIDDGNGSHYILKYEAVISSWGIGAAVARVIPVKDIHKVIGSNPIFLIFFALNFFSLARATSEYIALRVV